MLHCRRAVARRANRQPTWLAAPEKRDYFVDHSMSFGSGRGDRAIPATGASGSLPTSRCKITHWRKILILQTKNPILQTGHYKRILSGQPAVLISLIAHISGTPLPDRPHHGPFTTPGARHFSLHTTGVARRTPTRQSPAFGSDNEREGGLLPVVVQYTRTCLLAGAPDV
jgi:hypothetical protein